MKRPSALRECNILLAEDELLISRFLRRVLEQAGAQVTSVRKVSEITDLSAANFDGALLDVSLEDGDVYPAAELLAAQGVPLVFHSGHDQPSRHMKPGQVAASLDKPAMADEIIQTLASCIFDRSGRT